MTGGADQGPTDAVAHGNLVGAGLVLGALGGLAVGAAFGSMWLWLAAGVAVGLGIGLGLKSRQPPAQT